MRIENTTGSASSRTLVTNVAMLVVGEACVAGTVPEAREAGTVPEAREGDFAAVAREGDFVADALGADTAPAPRSTPLPGGGSPPVIRPGRPRPVLRTL